MFKLLRFYAIASFVSIFVTAALLTVFYRHVTVQWINLIAERGNLALAQTALNVVKPELLYYLRFATKSNARQESMPELPPVLAATLKNIMPGTSVVRFKIFNRDGIVVFSTQAGQIGTSHGDIPEFKSALAGKVASNLVFRDTFNFFTKATEADNLLQTFIPVRSSAEQPILGVLEIYTDVNEVVRDNTRMLVIFLVGTEAMLALLYAVLVLVVRRAGNIIEAQQQTIQKRTSALEMLSRRLMKSEEVKKKKIATDLHEGLAQTLSAIKAHVENSRRQIDSNVENTKSLESIVPVIQNAIQEVRSIATELRPSSLDDLGLIPTLNWYCREFTRLHPEIQVERKLELGEDEIPRALRIDIFRIVEMAFDNIALYAQTDRIELALRLDDEALVVEISNLWGGPHALALSSSDLQLRFSEIRERVRLSYGVFSVVQGLSGSATLRAAWPGQNRGNAEPGK